MKVAIVILNWNGEKMLREYLHSVEKTSKGLAEIIVADNASTDGSIDYLREQHPDVRIIQLEKNWGFAEGYNKALAQVEAEYYVLLNSDVEPHFDWLEQMFAYMEEHPDVAVCQPTLLSLSNRFLFEYAGAAGGYLDRLGYPFCRGRIFDTIEPDDGQYDEVVEVLWASGACMMVRSKDYWEAGGFDGRFFAHCEEIDLCWRMRLMGKKIIGLPRGAVFHLGGGTLPKGNPMKTYLNFRNNLTMLYKNLPEEELRGVMRWRWLLDYVAAWQTLLLKWNWGDFKAIYKARRDFKRWLPQFTEDRARIQSSRKVGADDGRKRYCLLWQYYVRRRKHFSQLP